MSKGKTIESRTEELLMPIAEANGVEIYDVEYVKEGSDWYLRAYIDKPGGVTIQDCEQVSRTLSDRLDEEDYVEDAYILEVSSPGLGRALKKNRHLQKSLGERVCLRLYRAREDGKEFEGILKAFDDGTITLEVEAEETVFNRADIALIRLAFDF